MQASQRNASRSFCIKLRRACQGRLIQHSTVAVQILIVLVNTLQHMLRELYRCQLATT